MASSTVVDLKDSRIPQSLYWSVQQVADWVESIGYSQYKDCFTSNLINGRKLITITASHLPNIGVTDFEHIKAITKGVRALLELEEPYWNQSISLPPRNNLGMYIELKSVRGQSADSLNYQQYLNNNPDPMWQPQMNNYCQLLPSS